MSVYYEDDVIILPIGNLKQIIYTETGKYDLAKEHLVIAANSNRYDTPKNAYANLARLEIEHNKYESARRYLEKGLVKNNEFAPLLNYLGIILEHEGNYREAIFNYEKAIAAQEGEIAPEVNREPFFLVG